MSEDNTPRPLLNLADAMGKYDGQVPENDLVHMFVPLMREVAGLHAQDRVGTLTPETIVEERDGSLRLADPAGAPITSNHAKLLQIQPIRNSALKIVGDLKITNDSKTGYEVRDLQVADDENEADIDKPVYLAGYKCWEQLAGHHDELTDIFCTGLLMAALACDLDMSDRHDVETFSRNRTNLFRLNPRLHPVIATMIENMTALNRHDRLSDLAAIANRLENYREETGRFNADQVMAEVKEIPERRTAILSHLRDRLFDLSRRNKLIHFRPTQASVNLTVASVPLVMRLESIRKEQLCTWGSRFEKDVISGKPQPLGRWLRFEDQPYLPSALDRIIQQSRRDRAEYGFSNLRLVLGYLNWYNLKDAPNEKINSPLLWLPVDVVKKKGVRDQYTLQASDAIAEFNPALRHHLKQLYDIDLPETADLNETSLAEIHSALKAQINRTEPGVTLDLTTQPSIRMIHEKAVQRLRQYQKRRGSKAKRTIGQPDFSYDKTDYKPLGRTLFEKYAVVKPLPQRQALGLATPARRPDFMAGGAVSETKSYSLDKDDKGKFGWEIDLAQVTLAHFNYRKMSLVRDYASLIEQSAEQPSLDRLFSIAPRDIDTKIPGTLPPEDHWNVIASDATQDNAVAMAREGDSFIIQGPPGTGKSQTITNLIADFAARGKRVLFVCEKRAALDVVHNRLKQAGLEGLSCLIHDSQEDKKAFIHDLKDRYESWIKSDSDLDNKRALRDRTVKAYSYNFEQILQFENAMSKVDEGKAYNIRTLIRKHMELPPLETEYDYALREQLPSPEAWETHRNLAQRIERSMQQFYGVDSLNESPFARLSRSVVQDERAYMRTSEFTEKAEPLVDRSPALREVGSGILVVRLSLKQLSIIAGYAARAVHTKLAQNFALLDLHSQLSTQVESNLGILRALEKKRESANRAAANWQEPLDSGDTASALDLARAKETSFFKFLSGPWRTLKKTVEAQYDFAAHAVKPSITSVLEKLDALHTTETEIAAANSEIGAVLNTEKPSELFKLRDEINAAKHGDERLAKLFDPAANADAASRNLSALSSHMPDIAALNDLLSAHLENGDALSLAQIGETVRDMREALEELPDILPLLASSYEADAASGFVLRNIAGSAAAMEALIIDEALQAAFRTSPELKGFDASKLSIYARRTARAQEILFEKNAENIRATAHHNFMTHVRHSTLSVSQLNGEEKEFKKIYANGRREAEHEFGKTMRYRSIRDMASGDTGRVVSDLKPIWLMSPLSVSDTLPLDNGLFDVVIFDEASQIPVEDGIPALCRAPQLIVVGDEMQLPPTSFFSSSLDADDMEIEVQEDGQAMNVMLDADSLLTQSARHLPATLLAWHYRSRSEALISFSNAAFYDGQLVTIPDQKFPVPGESPPPLRSDDETSAAIAVHRTMERPISYHRIENGIYENRSNLAEAEIIAGMVREFLQKEDGLSIGIVAFSEAQQNCIEAALENLGKTDREFAAWLEDEYNREDDDQFNGLFVKNLENVQGDERDIIILSICYAPNAKGKMVMNFGPINQRGGEKRLNVIFSRARHHMAVISTIEAEAITNTHNDGALALRTFLAFAEARASGDIARGRSALSSINPNVQNIFTAQPPADALRTDMAANLRSRGHDVEEYVGGASFRCDLAIKAKGGDAYDLAILIDGGMKEGAQRIYERYVFKPGILRSFGWRVIDIPSHAWRRDKDIVLDAIDMELRSDGSDRFDDDPFENIPPPVQISVPVTKPVVKESESVAPPSQDDFQTFHFKRGTSDKFWRIALRGTDLIVNYGRTGTKGQSVTKGYDDIDSAKREMNKLILEKTRKGYEED